MALEISLQVGWSYRYNKPFNSVLFVCFSLDLLKAFPECYTSMVDVIPS